MQKRGLSDWRAGWDQTRARRQSDYVLVDDRITLATDFECGNGCHPRREGEGYAVDLEPEPGSHRFSGKSYYFCCGLQNHTGRRTTVPLRLHAAMDGQFGVGTGHVVVRQGDAWSHLETDRIHPVAGQDAVVLALELPAGPTPVFVSNFHWHPHSELVAWVRELETQPRARVSELGRSAGGRELVRIDVGRDDPDAPTIVMGQTPQPSEGIATHACRALVDYLVSDDPSAAAIRNGQRIILVPATNPDGTVLGLGVSHPSGRFPFFEGRLAAEGSPEALPGTRALWDLLETERPWWFVEWHGNNWARRPGHMVLRYRPHLLADAPRRALWERLDEQLLALPNTHHGNWTDHREGLYQDSIGFQAVTRLGAIAHMIKHHDKFPLAQSCRHAIDCLRHGVRVWEEAHAG